MDQETTATNIFHLSYKFNHTLIAFSLCVNGGFECENENCAMEVQCPRNMVYRTDNPRCGGTCSSYDQRSECGDEVYDGCGCPDGMVLDHDVSIV